MKSKIQNSRKNKLQNTNEIVLEKNEFGHLNTTHISPTNNIEEIVKIKAEKNFENNKKINTLLNDCDYGIHNDNILPANNKIKGNSINFNENSSYYDEAESKFDTVENIQNINIKNKENSATKKVEFNTNKDDSNTKNSKNRNNSKIGIYQSPLKSVINAQNKVLHSDNLIVFNNSDRLESVVIGLQCYVHLLHSFRR